VRVITGTAKGRPLKTVPGRDVRPTADRVKESIFNVIGPRVMESQFLDLFAGSGNIGVEALSRGASAVVFVELVTAHLAVIAENLTVTGLRERAHLLGREAISACAELGKQAQRFDLIFVDPPYGQELVPAALAAIARHDLLLADGWVICEHHRRDPMPDRITSAHSAGSLERFRELTFGETVLSLYREELAPNGRQSD
jgi:16S rRNA (guanine966-N2)-methyltransferase